MKSLKIRPTTRAKQKPLNETRETHEVEVQSNIYFFCSPILTALPTNLRHYWVIKCDVLDVKLGMIAI